MCVCIRRVTPYLNRLPHLWYGTRTLYPKSRLKTVVHQLWCAGRRWSLRKPPSKTHHWLSASGGGDGSGLSHAPTTLADGETWTWMVTSGSWTVCVVWRHRRCSWYVGRPWCSWRSHRILP
eukprot:gene3833-biopygen1668